jgi:hypothetical protein
MPHESGVGDRTFYYITRALHNYDECIYAIPAGAKARSDEGWSIVLAPAEACAEDVGRWWVYIYPNKDVAVISFRPNRARYEAKLDLTSGRAVITRFGEVVRDVQVNATIELAKAVKEYIEWSVKTVSEVIAKRGVLEYEA